jgi:lipoprotein-releasing system ATP-binding protein
MSAQFDSETPGIISMSEASQQNKAGDTGEVLVAREVVKSFPMGKERLTVLKGASFSVREGEMVAIMGVSGAGKTTFLHILGALDHPDSGSVEVNDVDITRLRDGQRAVFRNSTIGFVFQFYHLLADFNLLENVLFPAKIARRLSGSERSSIVQRATELLNLVGLGERLKHKPGELSGGEQQRAAIARALLNDPRIVLADEPTGNLDSHAGESVFQLLRELNRNNGKTIVIATHDQKLAGMCNRVVRMTDGLILE